MGSKIWIHKLVAIILSLVIVAGSLGINIPISYANDEQSNINQDILISEKNVEDTLLVSDETELTTQSVQSLKSQNCFASGYGTEQEPYELFTKEDLIFLTEMVNIAGSNYNDKCYRLMNNISLKGFEWLPIGTESNPFSGGFDGNGYMIEDISIEAAGDSLESVGFFGYIKFGRVCDLTLRSIYIKSEYNSELKNKNIGSLAGHIYGEKLKDQNIQNIKIKSTEFNLNWNDNFKVVNVGGMCGLCEETSIIESTVSNIVMPDKKYTAGDDQAIGGFVAKLDKTSMIDRCETSGHIVAYKGDYLGGFVGHNYGKIKNCSASVWVKFFLRVIGYPSSPHTGGFVGNNEGFVENSFSIGQVPNANFNGKTGTFCGYNKNGYITNCYSSAEPFDTMLWASLIEKSKGGKVQYVYAPKSTEDLVSGGKVFDSEHMEREQMINGELLDKLNKNIEIEQKADSWDPWYTRVRYPETRKPYLTVTFFNCGDVKLPCQKVQYNQSIAEPSVKNAGDELEGWYTPSTYGEVYIKWKFNYKVEKDLKLYAKWKGVNVTFNTDNDKVYLVKNFGKNRLITEPEKPTKIGYKFGGWYKELDCISAWEFYKDKADKDMTLYAKWIKIFNVNFDSDGGSEIDSQIIEKGQFLKIPQIPVKEGYIFNGMYKDKSFEKKWDFTKDLVDSDMTIYVKWDTLYSYKVRFDMDGGKIVKPPVYERKGYIFGGWYKEKELVNPWDCGKDKLIEDTILYASWKKI